MRNKLVTDFLNKIDASSIPQTTIEEVKYRDLSSSEFFNKNQKAILNDILDLYNKANVIEKMINESSEILEYETNYSNFKIKRLESEIDNIKEEYDAIINSKEYHKKYVYPCDVLTTSTANVDDSYNCVTILPKTFEPKTYIINDLLNETYMPVDIICNFKFENINFDTDVLKSQSNDLNNMFDGSNKTYYVNSVTTEADINNVVASIEFEIPDSIITSRNVNELLIKPYPANSMDILNIEYKTPTGSYQQLPNYQDYCMSQTDFNVRWNSTLEEYELIDVDSLKLNFKDIPIHKIKVTFRQTHFIHNKDNTNTFVLGFKCIEPRYNIYSKDQNRIDFIIQFPKNKIVTFDSIKPIFSNFTQINEKKVKFDFYTLYDSGVKSKILTKAPFTLTTSSLFVECRIHPEECSPNIVKFEARYKYTK